MRTKKTIHEACFDPEHLFVTTPAYMKGDAQPHEVYDGMQIFIGYVTSLVDQVQHGNPTDKPHFETAMQEDDFLDMLIMKAIGSAWKRYDDDNDGFLTLAQGNQLVHELFDDLMNHVEQNIIDQEFKLIDCDKDGKVSKAEIVHFIHSVSHM